MTDSPVPTEALQGVTDVDSIPDTRSETSMEILGETPSFCEVARMTKDAAQKFLDDNSETPGVNVSRRMAMAQYITLARDNGQTAATSFEASGDTREKLDRILPSLLGEMLMGAEIFDLVSKIHLGFSANEIASFEKMLRETERNLEGIAALNREIPERRKRWEDFVKVYRETQDLVNQCDESKENQIYENAGYLFGAISSLGPLQVDERDLDAAEVMKNEFDARVKNCLSIIEPAARRYIAKKDELEKFEGKSVKAQKLLDIFSKINSFVEYVLSISGEPIDLSLLTDLRTRLRNIQSLNLQKNVEDLLAELQKAPADLVTQSCNNPSVSVRYQITGRLDNPSLSGIDPGAREEAVTLVFQALERQNVQNIDIDVLNMMIAGYLGENGRLTPEDADRSVRVSIRCGKEKFAHEYSSKTIAQILRSKLLPTPLQQTLDRQRSSSPVKNVSKPQLEHYASPMSRLIGLPKNFREVMLGIETKSPSTLELLTAYSNYRSTRSAKDYGNFVSTYKRVMGPSFSAVHS